MDKDEQNRIARDKGRAYIEASKQGKRCSDCLVKHEPSVLDFDHRDPSTKRMSVANMPRNRYGINTIQREIDKCDIVCSNCHRYRTHDLTNPMTRGIMYKVRKMFLG